MTRCNRIAVAHLSPSLASQLLQGIASGRSATASVKAETTGAECHDLQQAAGHRDVLEEVNELVLIRQTR
jgi:hypothetical protein